MYAVKSDLIIEKTPVFAGGVNYGRYCDEKLLCCYVLLMIRNHCRLLKVILIIEFTL